MNDKTRIPELLAAAVSHHQAGRLDEADALYRSILASDPAQFDALTLLGTIQLQRGQREEGVRLIGRSLEINPKQPVALNNRGNALLELGRPTEALASFEKALALNPGYPDAWYNRGNVLQILKRPGEAAGSYERALALRPEHADAWLRRGNTLQDMNRPAEALASYDRALALQPDHPGAHYFRGVMLQLMQRPSEAVASYERAIALRPDHAEAHYNRGIALQDLKRTEEAIASYDLALIHKPNYAEAHHNRGGMLLELGRLDEAIASFDRALELKPDYAEAHGNRGLALNYLRRPAEALASFDKAIALDPTHFELYINRGLALIDLRHMDEALASYERAIALKPDNVAAYWNKSHLKLMLGQYDEGWEYYEYRWKLDSSKKYVRDFRKPLWLGHEDLTDKTILLHSEQGYGDSIHFCRYVTIVQSLGANVVVETDRALVELFSTLGDSIRVIAEGNVLPKFDYYCPLMSLPLAFKTTASTIPSRIPYLGVPLDKQERWRSQVGTKTRRRVGLVWSGARSHKNMHDRNIPLHMLSPVFDFDLEFHCLQKDIWATDRISLDRNSLIRTYENDLNDFADTAALISEMDLVISVDTSVAHLAGALGKLVWILLPYTPDYRWMLDRKDSPWYPSARLFRQPRIGDWESVITKVVGELEICRDVPS